MRITRIVATAAVLSIAAVPAAAIAKPKSGAWVGTPSPEFQFILKGSKISAIAIPCIGASGQVYSTSTLNKKVKVSSAGKFTLKGNITADSTVSVTVKGKISGKKGTAKLTVNTAGSACTAQTFKFKYYGNQGG
jgi:hypothetical protein